MSVSKAQKRAVMLDLALAAVQDGDYVGICVSCLAEHYEVEPDARRYRCEVCDEKKVYGAEEILLMLG